MQNFFNIILHSGEDILQNLDIMQIMAVLIFIQLANASMEMKPSIKDNTKRQQNAANNAMQCANAANKLQYKK